MVGKAENFIFVHYLKLEHILVVNSMPLKEWQTEVMAE